MSIELLSLDNVQEIAHQYGYWAVFIGIALENTGIPLPGETITIVGGFLAGSGELNYWLVLASSVSGAVLGDNFGYWIGKVGGWKFLVRAGSIFRIPEQQLELAREKFSKNAAQAVFLGRFVTLLRIFAGPLAGIAQMPYQQFFVYNLAGAALWSSTIISLSYFLGKIVSLQQIVEWIAQAGIVALLIVVIFLLISFLWEYRQKTLIPKD
jgi:membrane protein DedA with SNARE-associated domain